MRTLIASNRLYDEVCSKLRQILQEKVDPRGPVTVTLEQIEDRLLTEQPEILVLVLGLEPAPDLNVLRRVRAKVLGRVLVVGRATEPKLILKALHEGADHYIDEEHVEQELEAVLARLRDREEPNPNGHLISILGASGGVGCSTLAVNLSVALAREHKRCALVDLKPGVSDLAALLDLQPTHTLADLCNNASRLDHDMLQAALASHESGVHLLAFTHVFRDVHLVTSQGVKRTLSLIRRDFPYGVADLDNCYHEEQVKVLQQSDVVLLVLRLDFTSLRNTRRMLEHLEGLGINRERIRFVVNRHGQAHEVPQARVEELLGVKHVHYLPDDPKTVNGANNAGVPVVLKAPGSKLAQGLCRLSRNVDGTTADESTDTIFLTLRRCLTPWLAAAAH